MPLDWPTSVSALRVIIGSDGSAEAQLVPIRVRHTKLSQTPSLIHWCRMNG